MLARYLKNYLAQLRLGLLGYFPYYGNKVFCPLNNYLFQRIRREGIYERDVCNKLHFLAKPNSWFFDIGANIGLTSIPLMAMVQDLTVVSVEPSPNSFPLLERTHRSSRFRNRWHLLNKAIYTTCGKVPFVLASPELNAFEGIQDTKRTPVAQLTNVDAISLDDLWIRYERPDVSIVKIDVEGAESLVLDGGRSLLARAKPHIVLEWTPANFHAYGAKLEWLLAFAKDINYVVFDLRTLAPIERRSHLRLLSSQLHENFVLSPDE